MLVQLFLVALLAAARGCPPCDVGSCSKEPERDCPLGGVPDPCECCPLGICALEEGRPCYNATVYKGLPDRRRLGACASNMICLLRSDLPPEDGLETMCVCADQRIACGSDNSTYESTCKMYRVENNKRVTLQHWGPCHQAPQVTSGPETTESILGHPVLLACEAQGFPVPAISWEFQTKDGAIVVLPGDDPTVSVQVRGGIDRLMVSSWMQLSQSRVADTGDDPTVSVQVRGGPNRLMVSSWMQLSQSRVADTGDYSCVAVNHLGSTRASAHLSVQPQP